MGEAIRGDAGFVEDERRGQRCKSEKLPRRFRLTKLSVSLAAGKMAIAAIFKLRTACDAPNCHGPIHANPDSAADSPPRV